MELKESDYEIIQKIIDVKGKEIFADIFNEYFKYISNDEDKVTDLKDKDKMKLDFQNNLVDVGRIIVVDKPNETDIKDFGGIDKVPPGHGGRHKRDNMIHIYPYSSALKSVSNIEEIITILINEIVVHEIFHFYAKPDIYNGREEESDVDKIFKHSLTEGIVQTLTNKYMKEHNLGMSQTGYVEELLLVSNVVNDLRQQEYNDEQILYFLINDNYKELINRCKSGENIKNNYIEKIKIHEKVTILLKKILSNNEELLRKSIYYFKKMTNMEEMYKELVNQISVYGFDSEYLIEVDNIFESNLEKDTKNIKK